MTNKETEIQRLQISAPEIITPEFQMEVSASFDAVVDFDKLDPSEIRERLAVPHIRRRGDGEQVILRWITLGEMGINFNTYVGKLKKPPTDTHRVWVIPVELAVSLKLLKDFEPLRSARDYFTENFDGWHQRVQGITLRDYFQGLISRIRREQHKQFYTDAASMEQLVLSTDYVHLYCLTQPLFREYAPGRLISAHRSWLDYYDGKDIGYTGRVLTGVRSL